MRKTGAARKTLQEALQRGGRFTLVYKPEDADLILNNVRAGIVFVRANNAPAAELEARAGLRLTAGWATPSARTG